MVYNNPALRNRSFASVAQESIWWKVSALKYNSSSEAASSWLASSWDIPCGMAPLGLGLVLSLRGCASLLGATRISWWGFFTTLLSWTYDSEIGLRNIEPRHSYSRKEKRDKGGSYSTDDVILYSLRSPITLLNPKPPLISWRSPLREATVESVTDPTGFV